MLLHHPQRLSTLDKNPALFTSVADYAGCHSDDFFEIIALDVGGLKTFRTITGGQLIGCEGQMAMLAPYPVVPFGQEHELAMLAGGHRV